MLRSRKSWWAFLLFCIIFCHTVDYTIIWGENDVENNHPDLKVWDRLSISAINQQDKSTREGQTLHRIALNSRCAPHLMPNNNRQLQCPLLPLSRLGWQISWLLLLSSLQLRRWCWLCFGVCQIPRWSSSTWPEVGREMTPQLDTVARSLISESPLTPLLLLLF